jgi:Protein of unknown function (DUF998)
MEREPVPSMARTILLVCGILSSLLYVAMNVFVPMQWEGYSSTSQTVSELSAIGAPTRPLWIVLAVVYILLFAAFGWGVWRSAAGNRPLRIVGGLILAYCVVNVYWPPMHLRGTAPSWSDTLHIVWAMTAVLFMMSMMGIAAAALGTRFRFYTIATLVVFVVLGALTGNDGPRIAANLPTPWVGVWERILIALFLSWVVVLAVVLLRRENRPET